MSSENTSNSDVNSSTNDGTNGALDAAINQLNNIPGFEGATLTVAKIPAIIPIKLADNITVHYTTRLGGHSRGAFGNCNLSTHVGDNPEHVAANRYAVDSVIENRVHVATQKHTGLAINTDSALEKFRSDAVKQAVQADMEDNELAEEYATDVMLDALYAIEADGQVTAEVNRPIGVFAADCLPVLLADPSSGIIGAAHCGRRGLMEGIIVSTVERMIEAGAHRESIVATLGPRICGDCYEVGEEIATEFDEKFPGTRTITRFGDPGIDIAAAALQSLDSAGILRSHIVDSLPRVQSATYYLEPDEEFAQLCANDGEEGTVTERLDAMKNAMCTVENPLWFSHRRAALAHSNGEGRFLALIARRA